jgi:hypothetical protein
MNRLALVATFSALICTAQAQPAVNSIANLDAYVEYVRLVAKARNCGLRTTEWEALQQAKLTALIARAVTKDPGSSAPPDGTSLAAGAVIAASQEARSFPQNLCEPLKPLVDELDAALPGDAAAQR